MEIHHSLDTTVFYYKISLVVETAPKIEELFMCR